MARTTKATAHAEGMLAFPAGIPLSANPHALGSPARFAWSAGWYLKARECHWPFPIPKEKLK